MPESIYSTEDERWFFHTGRYENWPIDEAEQDIEEDLETYGDPGDENDCHPSQDFFCPRCGLLINWAGGGVRNE
jgi:hypothetical protein